MKAKENSKFYKGKACSKGHASLRYISTKACVECTKIKYQENRESKIIASRENYRRNPERVELARKEYYLNNKEKFLKWGKDWKKNNPEKVKESTKRYYYENKEKEATRTATWAKNNKDKVRAKANKYRAKKLNAIPKWADLNRIVEIYENCPEGYEVDHIIPLQGKTVSGLHVENNLQYLTKTDNCRKGNKLVTT